MTSHLGTVLNQLGKVEKKLKKFIKKKGEHSMQERKKHLHGQTSAISLSKLALSSFSRHCSESQWPITGHH